MRLRRPAAVSMALLACTIATTACASTASGAQPAPGDTITVSAASSLTDVLPVIAKAFETRFPGTTVRLNFGGSSQLVEQVNAGAPVDVLITASESTMQKAVDAGTVERPLNIASNSLAIALPPGNRAGVTSLQDLQNPDVRTAVCAPAVPCGAAAEELFTVNNVPVAAVTEELDVRAVLGKVIADEVDAGIVYVTDVRAAGDAVTSVAIQPAQNVTTTYPMAQVTEAPNPVGAQTFVSYVRDTPSAQDTLRDYGFAQPR